MDAVKRKQRNGVTWCGPAALTAITGKSYEECEALLAGWQSKRPVTGVGLYAMRHALEKLGYTLIAERTRRRQTLVQWHRGRSERRGVYLVSITGHYCVVRGDVYVDNHTVKPVAFAVAPNRRALVRDVHLVMRTREWEERRVWAWSLTDDVPYARLRVALAEARERIVELEGGR